MSSRKKAPGGRSHSTKGQRRAARKRLAGDTTEEEERHRGEASERERAESPDQSSTASLNAPSRSPRWPPLHSPRRSPASSPSTHSHLQFPTLSDAAAAGGQQQPANAFEKLFRFLCEDATSPTKGVEEDDEEDEDEEVSHLTSPSRSASEWMLLLLFLFALLLRYLVSGGAYSGMGKPPMFGDYEAQRHWMEITVNLPISEWYHNTTQNDLQYWGLDYPPLTAYVSWAFGKLAQFVGEGALVELGTSRGYESLTSKYFMRLTVLFCDAIIFLPAIYLALRAIAAANTPRWEVLMQTHLVWISPAFILIDHGHFQYNCVSLGLIVWAVYFHWRGQDFLGSIAFVASLAFKQMSLYFAPAFFAYLLARVMQGRGRRTVPIATRSVECSHANL
jgi:hypothetical protein